MGTVTISVDDDVEKRFREAAREYYGEGKGILGKAVTEAMEEWAEERSQKRIAKNALTIMKKGFRMGRIKYTHRSELYGRTRTRG